MPKKIDLTGHRYGILTVLYEDKEFKQLKRCKEYQWVCKCDCGQIITLGQRYLRERDYIVKSCGCLFKTADNMSGTRPYVIWFGMKDRCNRKNNTRYKYYGSRGISYEPRWEDFNNFWEDMKEGYADNLSLDRIDNNKNYSKDNCRWVAQTEQVRNRRNTKMLEYKGITKPLAIWAEEYNMTYRQLSDRIYSKCWDIERALTQPLGDRSIKNFK